MCQVNKEARSTWDDKAKGYQTMTKPKGNKLWESAIAIFWFIVGVIGAACKYIIKNKKNIVDFCYNVMMVASILFPSKKQPKAKNRKPRSKK